MHTTVIIACFSKLHCVLLLVGYGASSAELWNSVTGLSVSGCGHISAPCDLSVYDNCFEVCWTDLRNGFLCLGADGAIEYIVEVTQSVPMYCWSCCC